MKLYCKEIKILKKQLLYYLLSTAGDPSKVKLGMHNKSSLIYRNFSFDSVSGRLIYDSFTDEELLYLLRQVAYKLGHSPAQGEILWVFRLYIKHRFKKWPYALKKAGLSKSCGPGGARFEKS